MMIPHRNGVQLSLIAALDENRLIATSDGIPWKLPKDVEHFRSYTSDKWLLLGRRTYNEMQGWFKPGHHPLILTTDQSWQPAEGISVGSVAEALEIAGKHQATELVCIGGGKVFEMALPHATALILTHIHASYPEEEGSVYFPPWSADQWQQVHTKHHPADELHALSFDIVRWERI